MNILAFLKPKADKARDRAYKRLSRLGTGSVVDWSEQSLNGLHMLLDEARGGVDQAIMDEIWGSVGAIVGAMHVLHDRAQAV